MNFNEKRPLYILAEIAAILRGENGCAWDREQTTQSLKPYLIEEAYEVYDAIESGNTEDLKEELGDLLYQVYAHSQIASEKGLFTIDDVTRGISDKLVHRHPHVFGDETITSADEVSERWEKIKKKEKSHRESILDGVPRHEPALLRAYRVQQKVSRIGFDWEKINDVMDKIDEEVHELKEAVASGNRDDILDESGDILFSIVNALRFISVNPEEALTGTINKFISRFRYVEKQVSSLGRSMDEMSIRELEDIWQDAKTSLSKDRKDLP